MTIVVDAKLYYGIGAEAVWVRVERLFMDVYTGFGSIGRGARLGERGG